GMTAIGFTSKPELHTQLDLTWIECGGKSQRVCGIGITAAMNAICRKYSIAYNIVDARKIDPIKEVEGFKHSFKRVVAVRTETGSFCSPHINAEIRRTDAGVTPCAYRSVCAGIGVFISVEPQKEVKRMPR